MKLNCLYLEYVGGKSQPYNLTVLCNTQYGNIIWYNLSIQQNKLNPMAYAINEFYIFNYEILSTSKIY